MAVPTTLVIDATQETLEITNSRDATALRGISIETGPPTDGEGLFYQSSSSEYVFRTVDESIDDRVAELIQDSAAGGLTWTYDDSAGTLTPAYVGDSTLVTTGALNSGSITSGFTSVDVGAGAISTTGTVTGGVLAGTLSTPAQTNVTSLGTLTALQVDNININLNTISSTAGTDLNITPLSGQQIVLDGAIIIDAGVVTGATSIASTAFSGDLTGDVTGNADTATALETARTIGGTSFDGTASIVPATITVADTTDTTSYVALFESATGDLAPKTDAGVTYNAGTGLLTATGFAGPLTGNVTGNVTGSSGSTTGNAATATALETARTIGGTSFDGTANIAVALAATATALASARTIGGVSFDGTGNIVPGTITVADTTDTTSYVALFESATGDLGPKTDAGITYNAGTGLLTATGFSGPLTGNVTGDCSGSSGSTTGNAATATLASTVTVADSSDTTAFPAFFDSATGSLAIMTDASNLTYNASTGVLTATGFAGPLTGNVTGDVSGSSGSTTGNAATATALQTARTIGGTSFDGTGNIVPATITVADTTDTTSYVAFFESATGDLGPKTDAGATYNASTGVLTATGFAGPLTGNVTGNVSGSSGSTTGNAATATLASTVTVADSSDTTAFPAFFDSATGSLAIMTDASNLTYNASTGVLTATGFAGPLTGNVTGDCSGSSGSTTGNSATATALQTARTIGGTSFDGTANVAVALAATATALASARTIGGVSFDGTGNIDLPGVNTAGSQDTSGTAADATVLETARTIGGVSFNGGANIDLPGVNTAGNQNTSGSAASLSATLAVASGGTNIASYAAGDILYASGSTALSKLVKGSDTEVLTLASGVPSWAAPGAAAAGSLTGTELKSTVVTSSLTALGTIATGVWQGDAITGDYIDPTSSPLANTNIWIGDSSGDAREFALSGNATMTAGGVVTVSTAAACTGNAATATALETARTIGGTSFDGTGNIAVALSATATALATARAINGVDFDGSAAITVTAAAGTLSGGTLASGVTASSLTSVGTLTSVTTSGDVTLDATDKIYLDGGSNTYVSEASADVIRFYCGGVENISLTADDLWIKADGKLYWDGGLDTYTTLISNNIIGWYCGNTEAMRVTDGAGKMTGNWDVTGELTAGTKTFKIDHPLPSKNSSHSLIHSCIEGPRADCNYRGQASLELGTVTVNLDLESGMTEGTFQALTRDAQCWIQNDDGWGPVRGSVEGNLLIIESKDMTSDDTVSWLVVAERQDTYMLQAAWTDDEGHPILEPEKTGE